MPTPEDINRHRDIDFDGSPLYRPSGILGFGNSVFVAALGGALIVWALAAAGFPMSIPSSSRPWLEHWLYWSGWTFVVLSMVIIFRFFYLPGQKILNSLILFTVCVLLSLILGGPMYYLIEGIILPRLSKL